VIPVMFVRDVNIVIIFISIAVGLSMCAFFLLAALASSSALVVSLFHHPDDGVRLES
jgi:uncharacterized membrane protein YwzB